MIASLVYFIPSILNQATTRHIEPLFTLHVWYTNKLQSYLYTKPGYNQTAFEFLNPEDRELVGEEILNLLGLGRVPETTNKKQRQKDKDKEFYLRAQENHTVSFEPFRHFIKNGYDVRMSNSREIESLE